MKVLDFLIKEGRDYHAHHDGSSALRVGFDIYYLRSDFQRVIHNEVASSPINPATATPKGGRCGVAWWRGLPSSLSSS